MKAVGEKYDMSRGWLYNILKSENIKARPKATIKYKINETFFDKIDSHNKAICLGFIWADGCLGNANGKYWHLRITLNKKDTEYLEWMNGLMVNERPIHISGNFAVLIAYHPQIVKGLRGLGIFERKSLLIGSPTLEQVPDEFISSFVLGVFEGDGGFCINKKNYNVKICGTDAFCQWLKIVLKEQLEIDSIINYSPTKSGIPLARIGIGGNRQVLKFMEWMYSKAPHRMDRKNQKYLELRALYDENMKLIMTQEQIDRRTNFKREARSRWTLSDEAKQRIGRATAARNRLKSTSKSAISS